MSAGIGVHGSGLRKSYIKDFNDVLLVQVPRCVQQCQLASTRWHSRAAAAAGEGGEGCGRMMGRSGS